MYNKLYNVVDRDNTCRCTQHEVDETHCKKSLYLDPLTTCSAMSYLQLAKIVGYVFRPPCNRTFSKGSRLITANNAAACKLIYCNLDYLKNSKFQGVEK